MSNARFGIRTRSGQISSIIQSSGLDSDALAFINAAGITDATQQSAINTLVISLKNNSLWTKFKAIYPMVGGTASSHKFNLIDPRDIDGAFRLTFYGGWTHSSTGALPNGSNAYAETYLTPSVTLTLNSTSIHYYSRNALGVNTTVMGVYDGTSYVMLAPRQGFDYSGINSGVSGSATQFTTLLGFLSASRTASTQFKDHRNGTVVNTIVLASTSRPTKTIYIGGRNNNGTLSQSTNVECAFSAVADGLSDAEIATLSSIVQAYQTTLSRQV
jgi:hypothetical protein